jgi:hypothetical protein
MREIALHLLDIAENSTAAEARNVSISVREDLVNDRLCATVRDDGRGMDAALAACVSDPFTTSRTTRKVGLGIPLLKAAAEACGGGMEIETAPGRGTTLTVWFKHSQIDRMPLGDLAGTWLTLLVAHPQVHWTFEYGADLPGKSAPVEFRFDDHELKEALGDLPLTEPEVLRYMRDTLESGVAQVWEATAPYAAGFEELRTEIGSGR